MNPLDFPHRLACCIGSFAILLLSTVAVLADNSEVTRTWTGTTGAGFEARLLSYTEDQVVLRRTSDGREFTIPLDRLIEADQDFVAALFLEAERDSLLTEGPYATMVTDQFEPGEFENGMLFNIWGSQRFDPKKRYPLVIHLHGIDLRGDDNEAPLTHPSATLLTSRKNQSDHPCFVLFPQCPPGKMWASKEAGKLHALIEDVLEFLPIDANRIYLTGNDMGGHGVWYALEANPTFYAAATVTGSPGKPEAAAKLKNIPTWSVCGAEDNFRHDSMRAMADAFAEVGATNAHFTAIPDADWVTIKDWLNEERLSWLFEQSRQAAAPAPESE